MGFFAFLILGLAAGYIAQRFYPKNGKKGLVFSLVLGVTGSLVGGWLGSVIFGVGLLNFWSLQTWVLAIGGSILVLMIYGLVLERGQR